MELKGSKTEKNLMAAFAGESMAYTKYGYFAARAKQDGYRQMGEIFTETAANEKEHAEIWFKLLYDGMPDTAGCLALAAQSENKEWAEMYPRMATEAREEGFKQIAALFEQVGAIEKEHEARYQALAENLKNQQVFARPEPQVWQCMNCGHLYTGTSAPQTCPVCDHPQSYFEIKAENYR
jgi:rubrerythrin